MNVSTPLALAQRVHCCCPDFSFFLCLHPNNRPSSVNDQWNGTRLADTDCLALQGVRRTQQLAPQPTASENALAAHAAAAAELRCGVAAAATLQRQLDPGQGFRDAQVLAAVRCHFLRV